MPGEMCWLPKLGSDGEKILHLRLSRGDRWQPYTAFPQHSVPDYKIERGSKGWATFQHLSAKNWALIPSDQAYSSNPDEINYQGLAARQRAIANARQRGLVQ